LTSKQVNEKRDLSGKCEKVTNSKYPHLKRLPVLAGLIEQSRVTRKLPVCRLYVGSFSDAVKMQQLAFTSF
jgi:hypothetical protein